MAIIQVLGIEPLSGVGQSGKPYSMLKVVAATANSQGSIKAGDLVFFEGKNRSFPKLQAGGKYEPVFDFETNDGKLVPRLVDLIPIK